MAKLKLSQTYSFENSIMPNSIVQCTNGDYIIAGRIFDRENDSSAFAIRVMPNGGMVWQKIFSSPFSQFFTSIARTLDGNFIAVGSFFYSDFSGDEYMWIVKLDQDGNILWQKSFGTVGIQSDAIDVSASSDGGFIVTGLILKGNSPSTKVLKFDAHNNLQWDKNFDIGVAFSITKTMDGGFVLLGASNIEDSLLSNVFILRIDSKGQRIWEKLYNEFEVYVLLNGEIIETKNGHFAAVAKSLMLEVDSVGNVVWSKQDSDCVLNSIIQTDDNNYRIAGSLIVNNFDHSYISAIDNTSGTALWDNTEMLYPSEITQMILNENGDSVCCGYAPVNVFYSLALLSIF